RPGFTNAYPQSSNMGVFGVEGFTDGTSNTAIICEKLIGLNGFVVTFPGQPNAKRVSYATSVSVTWDQGNSQMTNALLSACKSLPSTTQPTNPTQWTGAAWDGSHAGTLHFNAYNHVNTPNGLSCVSANSWGGAPGGNNDAITATSNHTGGVNMGMGDGS